MTNGCLVTDEDAGRFRDLSVFDIQVSLEGPAALHDSIRGEGSFRAALKGTDRLAKAANCVSANVTLSRLNAPFIDETVRIARDAGFSSIGFSRLVPCGSGGAMRESVLSAGEVRDAYEKALALDGPDFAVVSGDPLAGTLRKSPFHPPLQRGMKGEIRHLERGHSIDKGPCRAIGRGLFLLDLGAQ